MRGKPKQPARVPATRSAAAQQSCTAGRLEVEGIDRMYLNLYVPRLQIVKGVLGFIRCHRGHRVPSTAMVEPITRAFVSAIDHFAAEHGIPVVNFEKGQRKDDVAARFRAAYQAERAWCSSARRRRSAACTAPRDGTTRVRAAAMRGSSSPPRW